MKRKIAALLATVLVMTMGATTVFAAVSPSAADAVETIKSEEIQLATEDTTVKAVETTKVDETVVTKSEAQAEAKAQVEKVNETTKVEDSKVAVFTDISLKKEDGTAIEGALEKPVTITIPVAGVTTSMGVIVMNYYDSDWHKVDAKVSADGKVEATFNHLSPVMVITYTLAPASNTGDTDTTTDETPASPKTGVVFPVAAIAGSICLAGAAVCGKKVKFN